MKTLFATLIVKTALGYHFIQQIKDMSNQSGGNLPDEPMKEILMAAFFPNFLFLFIGVLSFGLVWCVKDLFTPVPDTAYDDE